jgi:hypothetical protein
MLHHAFRFQVKLCVQQETAMFESDRSATETLNIDFERPLQPKGLLLCGKYALYIYDRISRQLCHGQRDDHTPLQRCRMLNLQRTMPWA